MCPAFKSSSGFGWTALAVLVILLILFSTPVSAGLYSDTVAFLSGIGGNVIEWMDCVRRGGVLLMGPYMSMCLAKIMFNTFVEFIRNIVVGVVESFFRGIEFLLTLNPTMNQATTSTGTMSTGATRSGGPGPIQALTGFVLKLLIPIYNLLLIMFGIYIIFMSGEPQHRAKAKAMFNKLLVGMVLVSMSPLIYQILLNISSILTGMILQIGTTAAAGSVTKANVWAIMAGYVIVGFWQPWVLWFPMLILLLTLLILGLRYVLVILFGVLFPLSLFLYFFDFTKSLGKELLSKTILWIFVPVIQAVMFAITFVSLTNISLSAGLGGLLVGAFMVLAGMIGIVLAPLAMTGLMKWVGATIAALGILMTASSSQTLRVLGGMAAVTTGNLMMGYPVGGAISSAGSIGHGMSPTQSFRELTPEMVRRGLGRGWANLKGGKRGLFRGDKSKGVTSAWVEGKYAGRDEWIKNRKTKAKDRYEATMQDYMDAVNSGDEKKINKTKKEWEKAYEELSAMDGEEGMAARQKAHEKARLKKGLGGHLLRPFPGMGVFGKRGYNELRKGVKEERQIRRRIKEDIEEGKAKEKELAEGGGPPKSPHESRPFGDQYNVDDARLRLSGEGKLPFGIYLPDADELKKQRNKGKSILAAGLADGDAWKIFRGGLQIGASVVNMPGLFVPVRQLGRMITNLSGEIVPPIPIPKLYSPESMKGLWNSGKSLRQQGLNMIKGRKRKGLGFLGVLGGAATFAAGVAQSALLAVPFGHVLTRDGWTNTQRATARFGRNMAGLGFMQVATRSTRRTQLETMKMQFRLAKTSEEKDRIASKMAVFLTAVEHGDTIDGSSDSNWARGHRQRIYDTDKDLAHYFARNSRCKYGGILETTSGWRDYFGDKKNFEGKDNEKAKKALEKAQKAMGRKIDLTTASDAEVREMAGYYHLTLNGFSEKHAKTIVNKYKVDGLVEERNGKLLFKDTFELDDHRWRDIAKHNELGVHHDLYIQALQDKHRMTKREAEEHYKLHGYSDIECRKLSHYTNLEVSEARDPNIKGDDNRRLYTDINGLAYITKMDDFQSSLPAMPKGLPEKGKEAEWLKNQDPEWLALHGVDLPDLKKGETIKVSGLKRDGSSVDAEARKLRQRRLSEDELQGLRAAHRLGDSFTRDNNNRIIEALVDDPKTGERRWMAVDRIESGKTRVTGETDWLEAKGAVIKEEYSGKIRKADDVAGALRAEAEKHEIIYKAMTGKSYTDFCGDTAKNHEKICIDQADMDQAIASLDQATLRGVSKEQLRAALDFGAADATKRSEMAKVLKNKGVYATEADAEAYIIGLKEDDRHNLYLTTRYAEAAGLDMDAARKHVNEDLEKTGRLELAKKYSGKYQQIVEDARLAQMSELSGGKVTSKDDVAKMLGKSTGDDVEASDIEDVRRIMVEQTVTSTINALGESRDNVESGSTNPALVKFGGGDMAEMEMTPEGDKIIEVNLGAPNIKDYQKFIDGLRDVYNHENNHEDVGKAYGPGSPGDPQGGIATYGNAMEGKNMYGVQVDASARGSIEAAAGELGVEEVGNAIQEAAVVNKTRKDQNVTQQHDEVRSWTAEGIFNDAAIRLDEGSMGNEDLANVARARAELDVLNIDTSGLEGMYNNVVGRLSEEKKMAVDNLYKGLSGSIK